jgi:hypothetical protein
MAYQEKMKKNPFLMHINPKKNPLLMHVNSGAEIEKLWEETVSQKKDISRAKFDAAIKQFQAQHHTLPKSIVLTDVPGVDKNVQFLIKVGKVEKIDYNPDKYSRKSPYKYFHNTKDESLYVDSTGKVKVLVGKTYMESKGKHAGWLVD